MQGRKVNSAPEVNLCRNSALAGTPLFQSNKLVCDSMGNQRSTSAVNYKKPRDPGEFLTLGLNRYSGQWIPGFDNCQLI